MALPRRLPLVFRKNIYYPIVTNDYLAQLEIIFPTLEESADVRIFPISVYNI